MVKKIFQLKHLYESCHVAAIAEHTIERQFGEKGVVVFLKVSFLVYAVGITPEVLYMLVQFTILMQQNTLPQQMLSIRTKSECCHRKIDH